MRGRGGLVLVGSLVLLAGYTTQWWAWTMLHGGGLTFADLLFPSRLAKASAWRPGAATDSIVAPGSTQNPNGTINPPLPGNATVDPNTGAIGGTDRGLPPPSTSLSTGGLFRGSGIPNPTAP